MRTNGTVLWSDTNIGLVRATVVGGSNNVNDGLDCDILAGLAGGTPTYTIDWIDAPNSLIGSDPANLIKIGTTGTANVKIRQITAKVIVRANVKAPAGIALVKIAVSSGGMLGTVSASTLLDRSPTEGGLIEVPGDMWSVITLAELPAKAIIHLNFMTGYTSGESDTPGIVVTGSQGLHGQIIFDNPFVSGDPPRWGRPIVVGSTTITRSSYYDLETSSAALGGGAIGEVPFYRYNQDCDPVYNPTNPEKILVTEFVPTGTIPGKSIKFRFYGPVRTNAAETDTDQPIRFVKVLTSEEVDQTDKVAITLKRGSDTGWSRQVEVKGKEGVDLMPGLYYIYARTTGPSRLYCDQLVYATNESVYSSWYPIELREDCNQNGVDDATDIAEDPWLDQWGLDGGLGANGRIDHCEWSGCPADFDFNGFVNGDDYDAFVYWYELGDPRADYDFNGFVNGDDFDAFVAAFNGGC